MPHVSNFHHTAGNHCGSTAMRDILHHAGLPYSEALCFGLGSGLGFYYFPNVARNAASYFFHGRGGTLERDLCAHLALDFEQGADDDAARAWETARAGIDADVPLLLHVELSRLPYYHTRTPFPGHRVVLAGYDDARGVAFLADNAFDDLQTIEYAALRDARLEPNSSALFPLRNDWLAVKPAHPHTPLADAIRIALRANARAMLDTPAPQHGIRGMNLLAEDFSNWGNAPDWEWCARFAYQLIEKRGTGGGMFRKMYAAYLREAHATVPALGAENLADDMAEIAREWTTLAMLLKSIATDKDRARFTEAGQMIRQLARREEKFWTTIKNLPGF